MKTITTLFVLLIIFSLNTFAQHVPYTSLEGHRDAVFSVAFSPDGKMLASGGDRTIKLWNAVTGSLIRRLIGHKYQVYSVAFSPDGKILASGSQDDTIKLWDIATGKPINTLREYSSLYSVAFSPDGKILASGRGSRSGDGIGIIRLWDVVTGELIHTLTEHTDWVSSVAFSPDGKMLASGSGDETIRLWRMPSTHVNIAPDPVVSPAIGGQFTIRVSILAGENVGGYQMSLEFDATALRYIESSNGDYLPLGAFFVPPVIGENRVTLGSTSLTGVSNGDGTLATVTFEVVDVKHSVINLSNVIITDSTGEHLPHFVYGVKVEEPSLLPSSAVVNLTPSSILSPAIGERLAFDIEITGGQNVKDFEFTIDFDPSALGYISRLRGNYFANGVGNGDGILGTLIFEVVAVKASTVSLSGYLVATNGLNYVPTFESAKVIVPIFGDVNRDGVVNILDLVLVASKFGQQVSSDAADINEDGVVNVVDLVKVAGALGGETAAPSAWSLDLEGALTREQVQQWLSEARHLNLTDAISQRGILYLEQLLAALTPKETTLLPNYPNPFNPET
ncbi:MAG: cohesin domain-containing protein [Candidatus Poribacteria bacterium]|nr:cohesin domain-containing protein [Candidatus Poribacteria bacterium]